MIQQRKRTNRTHTASPTQLFSSQRSNWPPSRLFAYSPSMVTHSSSRSFRACIKAVNDDRPSGVARGMRGEFRRGGWIHSPYIWIRMLMWFSEGWGTLWWTSAHAPDNQQQEGVCARRKYGSRRSKWRGGDAVRRPQQLAGRLFRPHPRNKKANAPSLTAVTAGHSRHLEENELDKHLPW